MKRNKNELIREVYSAMKDDPVKGDWIHLLKKDLEEFDIDINNEKFVESLTKEEFKEHSEEKSKRSCIFTVRRKQIGT
jgi:hypothetical protein